MWNSLRRLYGMHFCRLYTLKWHKHPPVMYWVPVYDHSGCLHPYIWSCNTWEDMRHWSDVKRLSNWLGPKSEVFSCVKVNMALLLPIAKPQSAARLGCYIRKLFFSEGTPSGGQRTNRNCSIWMLGIRINVPLHRNLAEGHQMRYFVISLEKLWRNVTAAIELSPHRLAELWWQLLLTPRICEHMSSCQPISIAAQMMASLARSCVAILSVSMFVVTSKCKYV